LAAAGALEQGDRPVVGVEHHLLRLPRIGPHEQHAAVTEPHMGGLHHHRGAAQQDHLVAPSRTGRLLLVQSSAGRKPLLSIAHAPCPTAWRNAAPHRNRRHSRARAALRRSGSTSAVHEPVWPRSPPAARRAPMPSRHLGSLEATFGVPRNYSIQREFAL